jgi:hypothetical protein
MLWNEEDREGGVSNWHCNCSSALLAAGDYALGICPKGFDFGVLRRKTAVAEKEMNKTLARLDRFDVCV